MHKTVMAECCPQMNVQHQPLLLQGITVSICGIKAGFPYLSGRIAAQPIIQLKGKLCGIHPLHMPRVYPESRCHTGCSSYTLPVRLSHSTYCTAGGIIVVSMVIFHCCNFG